MRFFDAHCDTVMRVFDADLDFVAGGSQAHVDLPRLLAAGSCVQLFAIFTARRQFPGKDLRAYADQAIDTIRGWAATSDGRMGLALTAGDLRGACQGQGFYGLLGLEGADCLGDQAETLHHFADAGVRNVIAAWGDNAFSGTVFGNHGPLTEEGAKLIELCEARRVMVDVSHLSDTAFWQVRDIARRPFIASHSNCRAVSPSERNLTDEMIRAVADRGGVVGINFSADFISADYYAAGAPLMKATQAAIERETDPEAQARLRAAGRAQIAGIPRPDMSWVVRHVQHALRVGGEDCIGLGGDLDGIEFMPAPLTGIESYPLIPEVLAQAGLTDVQVEKICWRNMLRVFEEVLPE